MTRRFTETSKWEDKWFRKLPLAAKVLFEFLRDKCDVAGFWQIDPETASFFTGLPEKEDSSLGQRPGDSYEAALDILSKPDNEGDTPKILFSDDRTWLYVTNFLRHQGNWPLKSRNNVTPGILKCFADRKAFGKQVLEVLQVLNGEPYIDDPESCCEGANKDLPRSKGKGKGNTLTLGSLQEEGCRGETKTAEHAESPVLSVTDCAGRITDLWNAFSPMPVKSGPAELAVERILSGLLLDGKPPLTEDEIVGALENYRAALRLPDSQAGKFALGKFLLGLVDGGGTAKYRPGLFNLDDFSKGNFKPRARDGPPPPDTAAELGARLKAKGML